MPKDPICGMEVDEKKAKFSLVKSGKKYYFCSKSCHDKFNEKISAKKPALTKKPLKHNSTIKSSNNP